MLADLLSSIISICLVQGRGKQIRKILIGGKKIISFIILLVILNLKSLIFFKSKI
jgi:hypothetical protein